MYGLVEVKKLPKFFGRPLDVKDAKESDCVKNMTKLKEICNFDEQLSKKLSYVSCAIDIHSIEFIQQLLKGTFFVDTVDF